MKNLSKILVIPFVILLFFGSCDDILEVDSSRVITEGEYQLAATNDSLYAMFGVFSKLQKLADTYVLAGELRADLMDVNDNADVFLKELSRMNYSSNNPYVNNIKDYYAIINNCNYIVATVDTTTIKGGVLVMNRLKAAAKAVRAWTYMQLALNFGEAKYYVDPILTLTDAEKVDKTAPRLSIEQLAPYLIADLLPHKDEENMRLGSFYSLNSYLLFFSDPLFIG
jgi:starch-binding outer membrane protein, SusD/RagB family